jgi:hypothetical protein
MDAFTQLYQRLLRIDFSGTAGEAPPHGATLLKAISAGANVLPRVCSDDYAQQLEHHLNRLVRLEAARRLDPGTVETLAGAVYQHRNGSPNSQQLERFLAVVSNLYRSFLDRKKRAAANIPLSEILPPVAVCQHDGQAGPFTVTVEQVNDLIGARIGVVSMPATYADDPFIWAALAHETGGHDVTHADSGLLDELAENIPMALAGMPTPQGISREDLTQLWAYWIDEASADVYGLLNIGPAFTPNLAVFFAALGAKGAGDPPILRMESGFDFRDPSRMLDPHPTDILRLHLAAGVIDTLTGLSRDSRDKYSQMVDDLATMLARGQVVRITGNIPLSRDNLQWIDVQVPLADMQQAARNIGGFIATAKLSALDGHSIQDIETWNDKDEARAMAVKNAVLAGQSIANLGDDAQLLAGVTLALLDRPNLYDAATRALNDGLDLSFKRDPIWGAPQPDAVYIRYHARAPEKRRTHPILEHAPAA